MSVTATVLKVCPNVQASLDENFMNCHSVRDPLPLLEYLLSPTNRQPIVDMVSTSNGKLKTVELTFTQRLLESTVSSNQANPTCSASGKLAEQSKTYSLDPNQNHQKGLTFDQTDFKFTCDKDADMWLAKNVQTLMDVIMRKIATVVATEVVALKGGWASDTTGLSGDILQVKTLVDSSTTQLQPFTMEDIDLAVKKSGYCVPGAIFGGETLYKYARRVVAGCCNDSGVDLGEIFNLYGQAVVWDRRVKTALGSEAKNLYIANGAVQVIPWTLWAGKPAGSSIGADYYKAVVTDPATGFPFDLVVKDNCGTVSIVLTATHKTIGLPSDMWADTDVYDGITGVAEIDVVNA